MEENKTMEVEVTEKESLMEKIKANKKTILKKGLIIAGSITGLVIAYKLMKSDKDEDYDDLVVDTDVSGDGEVTTEVEVSTDDGTETK